MGAYIQTERFGSGNLGKADWLLANENAMEFTDPVRTAEAYDKHIDCGRAVIAVVHNAVGFDAAGFAYSFGEYMTFTDPDEIGGRPIRYLVMPLERAVQLTGYLPRRSDGTEVHPDDLQKFAAQGTDRAL